MNFQAMPIIRFEIEHLKHSICSAMGVKGSELGQLISENVDKAILSFPFDEKVTEIVHQQINKEIADYFCNGAGATAIRKSITEALNSGN